MNKIDANICAHCGTNNNNLSEVTKQQLTPGTILRERFYVGFIIDQNGEGITYIAYDNQEKKRVRIREFFPTNFCERSRDGVLVNVSIGCEIQYKSLKTDFAELSKQLVDLKVNNNLLKAKTCFADNNTLYTVYEDIVGISLTRYLMENAGELSWEATENLFLPLLYTVKLLNQNGIIHRGISPETIIVSEKKELKLINVCLSGVRANNSEIEPELFVGYAAPEQYQKCTGYGEWTDVYAISAVLYRTLTGAMPPRSDMRDENESILPPINLNPKVPKTVSDAIVKGLAYQQNNRINNINDLMGSLYSSEKEVRDDYISQKQKEKSAKKFKLPIWLIVILITLPIMLVLFLMIWNMVLKPNDDRNSSLDVSSVQSSDVNSSDLLSSDDENSSKKPTSSTEQNKVSVSNFVGQFYEDVMNSPTYKPYYTFTIKEVYDSTVDVGLIIKQSIQPESVVKTGTKIDFTVSKGPQTVAMPPYMQNDGAFITVEEYQDFLKKSGFAVAVISVPRPAESSITDPVKGQIVKLSVPDGAEVDREKVKSITIYVSE